MDVPFYKKVKGGVCAARGFRSSAVSCGIKEKGADRLDLALIYSKFPTVGTAVFTRNEIKAAPVLLSMESLQEKDPRAIIANSGNANACTGEIGMEHARIMAAKTAEALDLDTREVQVCSTGIIGLPLPIDRIESRIDRLARGLKKSNRDAARAIMTSDTRPKSHAIEYQDEDGNSIRIGAIAKGAGMIQPNMATMLCFITTDALISKTELKAATKHAVNHSFNCISVDGDMSTNDTVVVMANGRADNRRITRSSGGPAFREALTAVMLHLAKKMVSDGERVTKRVELRVRGAATDRDAEKVARAVANSKLVKCSWNGNDPNWGRIIHAVGYAGATIQEDLIDISFEGLPACTKGLTAATPLGDLAAAVKKKKFLIEIDLGLGEGEFTMFTSDLSPEYVEFNREEYALTRRKIGDSGR